MSEETIFAHALEQLDPAARAAFLVEACGGDATLRQRVEALLRTHEKVGDFLDKPVVEQLAAPAGEPDATHAFNASTDQKGPAMPRTEGENSNTDEDTPLDFLEPSTRPDSLGRLGHYEMLQVLGKGGFGIVFRAFDDLLQRVVAVKVMAPQIATLSPARKRFVREAQSSAQVRHENVVQVYEVGEQPLPYLTMEFIPGETLQQRLDRCGPLDVPEVLRIGRQIAEGLAAAHACDLIHRDIKPGNVLLEGGSHKVKITDFGLARAADDASISQSGIVAGTPMFMSPEQALGHKIDQRADLFSLGSVLYQMASGRPPFRAPSALAVLKRVAEEKPRPIPEIIPETPDWLCAIIAKLHAKNPDGRFQSAREVADLLADCEAKLKAKQAVKNILPAAVKPAGRKWVAAAAAFLLLPVIALTVTEFAGVTDLFPRQQARPNPIKPGVQPTPVEQKTPALLAHQEAPPLAVAPFDAEKAKAYQEAWAKHLGVPVEFANSLGMTFRLIPPGEFQMGIDAKDVDPSKWNAPADWPPRFLGENWPEAVAGASPKHLVKLTRAFYIQTHEVRHGWYRKMLGPIPEIDAKENPDRPVHQFVSWPDAIAFCNALSKHEGRKLCYATAGDEIIRIADGDGYRLPTEAEWEFACRGGTLTPWFFGDNPVPNPQVLYRYQSEHTESPRPNPFGLFDMYGGSTEWVWDGHEPYRAEAVVDPIVPPGRNPRVARGSTCYDHAGGAFWTVNSFHRLVASNYEQRGGFVGFGRVVISIPVPAAGGRSAFQLAGGRIPFTDADVARIAALPAEKQLDAIAEELAKRNPGLDVAALKASAQIDDGKLIVVSLNAPYLADLSPLQALTAIPMVRLHGTNGVNLATLAGSTMQHLSLDGAITGLSQLPRLPSLTTLEVQTPTLTDVTPLNGWQLRSLNLHYSKVEDLSPLKGMPLISLNIHRTKVKDLSPLKGMKLEMILYVETEIQDISVLRDMPLRVVACDYQRQRDEAVLKAIKTLETINDKPVAEFWKDVKDK